MGLPSQWYRLSKPSRDNPVHRLGGSLPQPSNSTAPDLSTTTQLRASVIQVYEELSRNWNVSPLSDSEKETSPAFYQQLSEGECEIGWNHKGTIVGTSGNIVVSFFARLPGQEKPVIIFSYDMKHVRREGAEETELLTVKGRACGDEPTAAQLTQDRQDRIFALLPLRFFFEHGAAYCVAHPKSFYAICDFESIQAKKKKISLFWCCIPCDVALTINDDNFLRYEGAWSSPKAFNALGTSMEAAGSFKDAACIYEIAASRATLPEHKSSAHNNAGLAYRRVHLFKESEDQYRAGLRESFTASATTSGQGLRAQLNSTFTSLVCNNILTLYIAWRISAGETLSSPAEPWFCVLLARNGFISTKMRYREAMLKHYEAKLNLPKLSKAKAQQHLMDVIQCTAKEDYYAKLLELRAFGKQKVTSNPRWWPINRETLQHFDATDHKESHQDSACGMLVQPGRFLELCGGCCRLQQCADEKFLQCARCRSISYCSKECQITHWKAGHKQLCKEVKKTSKSKKKQSSSSGSSGPDEE